MSWEFLIFGTGVNIFMSAVGALWCLAPDKFVRVYRRVLATEKASKTIEWQRAVCSVSGRVFAGLLFVLGCIGLWMLYSPFRSK